MKKRIFWLSPFLLIIIFSFIIRNKRQESISSSQAYAFCGLPTCSPLPTCFPWPVCPTNTPAPEPTPTTVVPTNTPSPVEPSPTSPPQDGVGPTTPPTGGLVPTRPETNTCYKQCNQDYDCHSGQDCQDTGGGVKICRNPNCVEETDCECPGPAGGVVLGAEVTPTPKYGEVLGLAYTGSGEDWKMASIVGRLMVILGAFLLL